ncbi:NAD(P)H-quinone oxidoreductase [Rhodococcus coprophilus]|uniref:NADPH:quinone reductase n=1 Tax=Rhodococcus coprophilus TaxID=38310 RepID=A0A2X4UCI2_9NOCA|nr:NAD(P)H-quinone oxidoreductase [Rhodococcus coprophilus]MBM7458642.1 NADPH2:quinone reductase [Rhodococcus coprophilus]SQI33128.1 NADPH:quinone reductase [Rhodococcus coprophilus]
MHAIVVTEPGGPEVLRWTEYPDPTLGPGQVLLDVAATAVNRADLLQRRGLYPPPPGASEILGLECSGVIAELGEGVSGWNIGDHVCALLSGGGYAEQVVVSAAQLLPVPAGIDIAVAASLPEIACTVWSNVVMTAGLQRGDVLLVHGGGGGIGTHAIQVGKALGAKVAVTASAGKLDRCRELGADLAIDYRSQDFVTEVRNAFGGADVVLDNMGAAYLSRNIDVLAPDGRLVVIGMQGGTKGEMNFAKLLAKRGHVIATGLRGRPDTGKSGKSAIVASVREHLWPLIEEAKVQPVVHAELPITEAARAHEMLDGPDTVGKVVLRVGRS